MNFGCVISFVKRSNDATFDDPNEPVIDDESILDLCECLQKNHFAGKP